jgi:Tfp pilus assembly protein PilE
MAEFTLVEWLIIAIIVVSSLSGLTATASFVWYVAHKISTHSRSRDS